MEKIDTNVEFRAWQLGKGNEAGISTMDRGEPIQNKGLQSLTDSVFCPSQVIYGNGNSWECFIAQTLRKRLSYFIETRLFQIRRLLLELGLSDKASG